MALKPNVITLLEKFHRISIIEIENSDFIDDGINCYFRRDKNDEVIQLALRRVGTRSLLYLDLLDSLQTLDLSFNKIKHLSKIVTSLPDLRQLNVSNNLIEDIEVLKSAPSLQYVNFANNKITDLSPLYPLLKKGTLTEVFAVGNKIAYPRTAELEELTAEAIFNWFDNYLFIARDKIARSRLGNTKSLDLGNCGLTDLSFLPELFEYTELKELYLSNEWAFSDGEEWDLARSENSGVPNNIYNIPPDISKLRNLEVLICGGDWRNKKDKRWNRWRIKTFFPFQGLKKLKLLNLSNNRIHTIGSLKKLPDLERLHLNNNLIKRVNNKDTILKLTEIYLSNNYLTDVSFLNVFPNLETIDIHANSIEDIFPIRSLIERLDIADSRWQRNIINVGKNNKIQPPLEVISEGKTSVLAHFEQARAELEIRLEPYTNRDIKLILVGNSNAGKSTFLQYLLTNEFVDDLETTHWLDIQELETSYNHNKFKLKIFDFGGQEYYHDTHHLFFTTQTAYILLWDKDGDNFNEILIDQKLPDGVKKVLVQNYPMDYWLDSIRHYSSKRDISDDEARIKKLVLQKELKNKKELEVIVNQQNNDDEEDGVPSDILVLQNKVEQRSNFVFFNQKKMLKAFPNIYDFSRISLREEKGLDHAKMLLFDMIQSISLIGQSYLGTWGIIKSEIEKNKSNYAKEFSFLEFKAYCNGIIKAIPEVQKAHKDQIEAVFFNDADTKSFARYLTNIGLLLYFPEDKLLGEKVFVNQADVLDKIYKILKKLNGTNGVLHNDDVVAALNLDTFNDECETIVEVMKHFKVIIPHPAKENSYLAPLYLPKEPVKSVNLFLGAFGKPIYQYIFTGFIHKTIILEFFSNYGNKALKDQDNQELFYYWREGIIIKDEVSREILLIKFINGDIDIKDGLRKKKACIEVYAMKNSVTNDFLDQVDQQLVELTKGMSVDKAVTANGKDFVPIFVLEEMEEKELWVFEFEEVTYRLSDFKKYLKKPKNMKNIFISYSKDDLTLVDTFTRHLAGLRQDGKVANWFCTELTAGKKWSEEIQAHFDQSDIVCFMVSPNFMKTKFILDNEVKWAFERKAKQPTFRIVPIILDFCRWTTVDNNLGDFTALPYTAKPVVDFKNQNMAWYIVVELIRIMIEKDLDPNSDEFYNGKDVLPKDVMAIYKRIINGTVDA